MDPAHWFDLAEWNGADGEAFVGRVWLSRCKIRKLLFRCLAPSRDKTHFLNACITLALFVTEQPCLQYWNILTYFIEKRLPQVSRDRPEVKVYLMQILWWLCNRLETSRHGVLDACNRTTEAEVVILEVVTSKVRTVLLDEWWATFLVFRWVIWAVMSGRHFYFLIPKVHIWAIHLFWVLKKLKSPFRPLIVVFTDRSFYNGLALIWRNWVFRTLRDHNWLKFLEIRGVLTRPIVWKVCNRKNFGMHDWDQACLCLLLACFWVLLALLQLAWLSCFYPAASALGRNWFRMFDNLNCF